MIFDRLSVRPILRSLPLLAAALVTSCAGYKMGPVKPEKLATVETVAVPTFKNMTLEPRSSVLITNEVIGRIQNDGSFKITTTGKADAILRGTVTEIRRRQLRSARTNVLRTREMEVQVWISYTLEDARTNVVLAEGRARGDSHMFLDDNFQLSERQALNEAAGDAAREIVTRLTEGIPGQTDVTGSARNIMDSNNERF